jgi:hypothetical protein
VATLANTKYYDQARDNSGRYIKRHPETEPLPNYSATAPKSNQVPLPTADNTRPSSSLSGFDIIDYNSTPFENTPSASPTKAPTTLPEPTATVPISPQTSDEIMATEQVAPFHGDKEDENPEDFLRSFFRRMGSANGEVKTQQFPNFLQADSVADEWFEELDETDKKDWNAILNAFRKRWPRKKAAKKTVEEYEEEITGLRLKMEDMGKKEKIAGRDVYTHIAWADKMATNVRGAKLDKSTTYIGHVRRELPKLLREKVGVGHTSWTAFIQAVRDVDIDHIRDGAEIWKKEQQEQDNFKKRIQQLEKLTASPTAPIRQQMSSFNIGNPPPANHLTPRQTTTPANPFTGTNGGSGNLLYPTQTKPPFQTGNTRPPPTQADRAAILTRLQKYVHHPDTEAGRKAHQAQQADWAKTHGLNATVTELTPYPLRPGTCPVGAGECFTCGFLGHMGRKDGSTCGGTRALHLHEQAWRAICSRILRQTRAAASVQLVTVDDYGTEWQEVQGNEEGPSN